MKKKVLVTGSGGLIGSEAVLSFIEKKYQVFGIDDNSRMKFFGKKGDVSGVISYLVNNKSYNHYSINISDYHKVYKCINEIKPDVIVHCAAQPSHDKAAEIIMDDYYTNAIGTLNLLESTRLINPECIFINMSTNKVYGDMPNKVEMREDKSRYAITDKRFLNGFDELLSIDQSTHSLFGASKLSADILVQEYGRYFNIPSCTLRGGCLTGPNHASVELHGFVNYLIYANVNDIKYTVFGYKGKQVRDNIHSKDVVKFFHEFIDNPKYGVVYNIGGGFANSISILESFDLIESISNIQMNYQISEKNRVGDHICYYTNISKLQNHYPKWSIEYDIKDIFIEIYETIRTR